MKDRTVYILLAVFIALGSLFFLSRQRWEKAEKAENLSKRVVPVEAEDVLALRLRNAQDDIDLVKEDTGWQIRRPLATRADPQEVSSLLSYLSSLSVERVLEEEASEQQKEDFGLLAAEVSVSIDATGATYDLRLGKDTLTSGRLYAMRSDSSHVLIVERRLRERLDKSLYDLRDKSLFSFDTGKVERLVYTSPSGQVAVEKESENRWCLEQPPGARADASAVSALLSRLGSARVQAFVDEPTAELAVYGLAEAATRITVWSDPEGVSETLLLGGKAPAEGRLYAMREGGGPVFELEGGLAGEIQQKVSELRDRRFASLDSWGVERVRIESASATVFSASRGVDRSWMGLPPVSGELKRYETDDYLRNLTDIQVDAFIDAPGPLAEYRLDPPDYQLTLAGEDREEVLRFGVFPPSATDELDVEWVYALRPDEASVLFVEPRVVPLLHRDFTGLLEPVLIPEAATEEFPVTSGRD